MENVLFKISFPAEFHAQTAVEAALDASPDRGAAHRRRSRASPIETQEAGVRIIDKTGPLANPADRDHCLQYMVAVPLLFGRLTAEDYEDEVARDPRIDALRAKMVVTENAEFSRDYLDPDKRAIGNAVQVWFADGTRTERVAIDYPIGHRRRRDEGIPQLVAKFERNLATLFGAKQRAAIVGGVRRPSPVRGAARRGLHGVVGAAAVSAGKRFRRLVAKRAAAPDSGRHQRVLRAARRARRASKRCISRAPASPTLRSACRILGITTLGDVLEDARRITAATELPLLVDVDTGFGSAFNIARTVREMERAGVAAIHIEDQEQAKRCGHRPNKATVAVEEMCDRLKAAVDARRDDDFVIMARTDAFAREGRVGRARARGGLRRRRART